MHLLDIITGDDGSVKIWNVQSGELKQEIRCVFHGSIGSVAWVDLGCGLYQAFVFGCSDGTLHLYVWDDQTVICMSISAPELYSHVWQSAHSFFAL